MPTSIDELQIEINANATKANVAIDRLVGKLDRLSGSLGRMNTANLTSLANGVDRLGKAMQTMNTVKTADFTRLAKNMQQMGNINVVALQNASVAMSRLARGFSNLGGVSSNSYQVAEMAKSLGKLGGVNVQRAITNIPQLANAMRNLMTTLSNAPRVNQNVIQMANAMANLASQGAKVGTSSRSMQNGLNRTATSADRAKKSFGGLASVIGKFYASYFLVIRGLKSLGNSINSTADYTESFNFFTVSMGKIASKWDKDWENYGDENARNYSNSFATTLNKTFKKLSGISYDPKTGLLSETGLKNLGLNLQEVTQYAAQLSAMMDSVGQNGEVTLATTDAFVKLAGDLSSLYNIDYSQAANKLQSVLMGQSRAGYSLGWDTTMASLQETANKFNVTKPVSEMAQFEKQQLRILTILDQSKVAWGDQANTINTLANQIRMFKNNIKEAGMTLGQLFIPVLTKILPLVNGLLIAFKRLFTSIAQILGVKMEDFGQGYTETEGSIEDLTDDYNDLTDAAKEYKNQAMSFDEINPLKDTDTGSNKDASGYGAIDLTDEILDATSEYEKAWEEAYNNMQTKAEKFANGISKALKPISTIFEDIAKGDWLKLGKDTSELTTSIFNFFTKAIKKVKWDKLGENIGKFLVGVKWSKVFSSLGEVIVSAIEGVLETYFSMIKTAPLETALITAIGLMKLTNLSTVLSKTIEGALGGKTITLKKGAIGLALATGAIYLANYAENDLVKYVGSAILAALAAATFGASIPLAITFGAITFVGVGITELIKKAFPKFFEENVIPYTAEVELGASFDKTAKAVEKLNSEYESYIENTEDIISNSKAEEKYIDKLWKNYQKLADKEKLSSKEKKELVFYANELVKKIPELSTMINTETGAYTAQKKEINKVIKATKEKIKTEAMQSVYTEAVKQQVKAEAQVQKILTNPDYIKAMKNKAQAQERLNIANKAYYDYISEHSGPGKENTIVIEELDLLAEKALECEGELGAANKALESWNTELESAETVLYGAAEDVDYYGNAIGLTSDELKDAKKKVKEFKDATSNDLKNASSNAKKWTKKINEEFAKLEIPIPSFKSQELVNQAKATTQKMQSYFDKLKLPDFGDIIISVDSSTAISKNNPFKKFADGGFAETGQLFVAREAGPELVATMGGRTAIANNDQIVTGIAEGIYPAVYNAVSQAMANSRSDTNVNVTLEGDAKKIFKSVQKQATNYTMQTGKSAFA